MQHESLATTEIGYILKSYPRTSETFIANEIHLLEQQGLRLRLFSLLTLTDPQQHAVVAATQAPRHYLPQTTALGETAFNDWLRLNTPPFSDSHSQLVKAQPQRYLETLWFALELMYQHGSPQQPATNFLKEFLQAGYIAQQVLVLGTVRHLHAHFAHSSTTVAMFVSRLTGLPYSFTAHAKDIYLPSLNPGDLLAMKLRHAQFVVTCTRANHKYLSALNATGTPIHTIYHGLDTQLFTPGESATAPIPPVILTVGRVVEKKGFPTLLEACRILKERGERFRLRFISGAGPGEAQIVELIQKLQLNDVVSLEPAVTQETLKQIYQQVTLFALPCQIAESGDRDGIPNVLVEAMAAGLPVVSTNVSGIPELIEHGVSGWLVEPKDPPALAEAIARLLHSPALRQALGAAAREKVCRLFDAERNVQTLHQLFLDCLAPPVDGTSAIGQVTRQV